MTGAPAKRALRDLAAGGGTPAFGEPRHVGQPDLGPPGAGSRERFLQRAGEILDSRWFTNDGPFVRRFEEAVQAATGAKHCVAMCNGTVALEIATRALGMRGEVIVPSLTFIATAHALSWQGIEPVFCDVDPDTLTLDPRAVEALVTERTTGIIGVHLWGKPCNVESLAQLARRRKLKLLFDAAHALGCRLGGRSIGQFGDAEVLSFHATKFVNAFEGGAVTTNDAQLAEKMRLMRNFGFSGYDNVVYEGTNGKMSEICAAMGLTSLEAMPAAIAHNRGNYRAYEQALAGVPGLRFTGRSDDADDNLQYVVLLVDEKEAGIGRDALVEVLWAENVRARRYFWPGCHRMPVYAERFAATGRSLPVTDAVCGQCLVLPTGAAVSAEDVRVIAGVIKLAVAHGAELTRRLKA